MIESCGNSLLTIAAQPVFSALQTSLARSALGRRFHARDPRAARADRRGDRAGDGDAAGDRDARPPRVPGPFYERAWRGGSLNALRRAVTLPLADVRVLAVEQYGRAPGRRSSSPTSAPR